MRARIARGLADIDYYQASPLGWKHGTVIVWAGMRGVVTLAAAQTLPHETAERPLLVFVAFLVAVGSLMVQGLTLPWLVRVLRIDDSTADEVEPRRAAARSTTSCGRPRHPPSRIRRSRERDGSAFTATLVERRRCAPHRAARRGGRPRDGRGCSSCASR